ncbi:DNA-directed DNA polymerase [Salmonella phage CRW-SP2]|nr:DNA-directed DNA polymerase [Salmonella phage CRW-SP2]
MCEELMVVMNDMTTPMNRRRHIKALHDKLRRAIDERLQVVDELVALGEFRFETLKRYNVSFTPNVQFFSNEKMSFLSEIYRGIYGDRKVEKAKGLKYEQWAGWCKEMSKGDFHLESAMKSRYFDKDWYEEHKNIDLEALGEVMKKWEDLGVSQDTLQQGLKILMNAGYGAGSNVWFKEYFNLNIAEAVTTSGQLINKWNKKYTDEYLNNLVGTTGLDYVIAGDTDSNYICIERLVKKLWPDETDHHKIVDNIDQWIKENYQPKTNEWAQALCDTMNGYEQRMVWEREVIASAAVWRAKKMYAMSVYDSEGIKYEKPKIKFKGLEARKSTTPEWCRERLVNCYEKILLGTEAETQELIAQYKEEYMKLSVDDIAQASGVSDIEKWLDASGNPIKGTHFAAKACIFYNKLVEKHEELGLTPIESGDKVNVITLKPGNPVGNDRLAFPGFFPQELGLEKWVDYQTTFEKTFIEPIQSILDVVGWNHKRRVNLLAMMGKKG